MDDIYEVITFSKLKDKVSDYFINYRQMNS